MIYNSGQIDAQVRLIKEDGAFAGDITVMPRARVKLPPGTRVDPHYLSRNKAIKVIGSETTKVKGK